MVSQQDNIAQKNKYAERRKFSRVDVPLRARILDEKGEEQPCIIDNISAGGALARAKSPPGVESAVIIYIDQLGRFQGRVVRRDGPRFSISFALTKTKAVRIADELTEIINEGKRGRDRRENPRIRNDKPATVKFDDGGESECRILDISLTGASIEIHPRPPLGAQFKLGCMRARVVRRHETGVGVVFEGSTHKMDKIIAAAAEEETQPAPGPVTGASLAKSFGKKTTLK